MLRFLRSSQRVPIRRYLSSCNDPFVDIKFHQFQELHNDKRIVMKNPGYAKGGMLMGYDRMDWVDTVITEDYLYLIPGVVYTSLHPPKDTYSEDK